MSENFKKIKKKYTIMAIVAGVVLGVCCGVAVTCALAVAFKRCAIDFFWALYIPIALVLSAGFGAAFCFLLRPTDKKIAKKLDRQFALREKAQTMVEFSAADGAMATLQREQTDEALGEVAKKRVDLKWLWKFAFIPVLALAMLFVGIFVPAKKSVVVDPPYNMTEAQKTALSNLIENVRASNLSVKPNSSAGADPHAKLRASLKEEDNLFPFANVVASGTTFYYTASKQITFSDGIKAKEQTTDESIAFIIEEALNGLMDVLEKEQPQSVMKKAVISAIKIVDSTVASANSYAKLRSSLSSGGDNLVALGDSLAYGATFFYSKSSPVTSFDGVKAYEQLADESISEILKGWSAEFMEQFATKADENSDPVPIAGAEASAKLYTFASALNARLEGSEYAPKGAEGEKTDSLYAALSSLANGQLNLTGKYSNVSAAAYYGSINSNCTSFVGDAVKALVAQSYNCMMDEYIRNSLARIFGINRSEIGDSVAIVLPENKNNHDPDNPNSGADVGGDIIVGSDDLVLDVDTGELVPYGTLLEKYYRAVTDHIESGACGDEVALYIRQYFALLTSGIEDKK